MATTENINPIIVNYQNIQGKYSFSEFLTSANINGGTYECISKLLARLKESKTVVLSENEIKSLNTVRDNNKSKTNLECSAPIVPNMKISELETIFGEYWKVQDGNAIWAKKNDKVNYFWNDNNKRQVDEYKLMSYHLGRNTYLSFKPRDLKPEDEVEAIRGFFKLFDEIDDDLNRDGVIDVISNFHSVISAEGQFSTTTVESLITNEAIPRLIARHFVSQVPEDFFKDKSAIKKYSEVNYTYKEILSKSQQENDSYADVDKILDALLQEEGEKAVHHWDNLGNFLTIIRLLRNGKIHSWLKMLKEGEQYAVACFVLHTFVGTYLAIRNNLLERKVLEKTLDNKKRLTIYYNNDLHKDISEKEKTDTLKTIPKPKLYCLKEEIPIEEPGGRIVYQIERKNMDGDENTYEFHCGNVVREVPKDILWQSAASEPVIIWNGIKPHFFPDLSTVYAELKPYIEQAHEAAISRNAKATEILNETITELNGIVNALRGKLDENSSVIKELENDIKNLTKVNEDIKCELEKIQVKQDEQINLQKGTNIELKKHTEILDDMNRRDEEREEREKAKERREAEEDAKKRAEKERLFFRFLRYAISSISLLLCLMWLLYNIFGTDHNLVYLENNWSFFTFLLLPILAGMGLLWVHRHYSKYSDKRQKRLDITLVVFSILFAIGAFLPNKGAERFISDYDFTQYDSVNNQKVVAYLERYVTTHKDADEVARIRLADYYMIINDGPNALRITEPMKNVTRYKEGCASAAEALYLFQKSRSVIWRIIENYKKIYHDTPPVPLQYLEGIMLFKGEGNISKIKEGFGILKRLADSGYARAQYDVGYYLCNIRVNKQNRFALIDITANSNFPDISVGGNLVEAADYLRQAATHLPEAAVELGSLYADLTVEDSAMKYLDRVTDGFYKHTPDSLLSEAFYQKALFYFTTIGNDSLAYAALDEAVNRKYLKATLYDAFLKEDPNRSIDIYNEVPNGQNIQGYSCYIPPVVYDYLSLGKDSLAYKNLVASRPHGRFNMDFVKGMKFFMRSEISRKAHLNQQVVADSTLALDYMKRSAYGENGCLYAKMICTYYNAKSDLRLGKYPVGLIKELHEIAEEIPFAYILEGYLRASNNNDSDYKLIEEASIRAMGEKHPAGAYLLTFMPEGYVEQIQKLVDGTNINKDKEELSKKSIMMQAGLRQTNRALKPYLLYSVYCLDRECDAKVRNLNFVDDKYKYYNITKMHFWADVAIANHAYYLETQLLPLAHHYKDEAYSRKLIEASLIDFPGVSRDTLKESHTIAFGGYSWETQSFQVLASFIKAMPEEYVKSLAQKYESDKVRKIFFSVDFAKKDVSPMAAPELYKVNLPLLGQISFMGLDTEDTGFHLLNEFSDIGKSVWKLDLHLEYK